MRRVSSSTFLIFAASSLLTLSFTVFGAPSTRSLASFSPSPVMVRISLMTLIFLSPALAQRHGELGLLLDRAAGGSRRRRSARRPRPEPRPRRPTSPQATSTARPPRARSGWTARPPTSTNQPFPCFLYLDRVGSMQARASGPASSRSRWVSAASASAGARPWWHRPPTPGRAARPAPQAHPRSASQGSASSPPACRAANPATAVRTAP